MKYIISSLTLLLLLLSPLCYSQKPVTGNNHYSPQGDPVRAYLNLNNISTIFKNDGISDIDAFQSNSGFVYPKGSGKTAVFTSGLIWGAFVPGDPQVRVGGTTYRTGLQGGKIISPGNAEDPDASHVRIYRVRPDVYPGGPFVDLSMEANDEGRSPEEVRAQYEIDWFEWRAQDGAPYEDINSNGIYEPGIDIPGYPGADQTIWFVANDLNPALTINLYGAQPLGIEMQATIWSYAQNGSLNNLLFRKYKLINKSNTSFDDMYVTMWSDADIGNSIDDFVGTDTLLSLIYSYNAQERDNLYEFTPPGVGFSLLQGPVVPSTYGQDKNHNGIDDYLDYAYSNGKRSPEGFINLPMTASYYFLGGAGVDVADPPLAQIEGSNQFYNFMQGRIGLTGEFFIDPTTGLETTFVLTGDPLTGDGWVDGILYPEGDRRMGLASGPFQMAVGDTQEVVVSEIAGAGFDNLHVIRLLRFYSILSKDLYNSSFDMTRTPIPGIPITTVTQQNTDVLLNWDNSSEIFNQNGFEFQGYNVYQLASDLPLKSNAVRLATFDVIDGVTEIQGTVMNPITGYPESGIEQYGSDSGIERSIQISEDAIDNTYFIPGKTYYFAVTAYTYNSDPLSNPNNSESLIKLIEIEYNDSTVTTIYGNELYVKHIRGMADGGVSAFVADPYLLTGHLYKISFDSTALGELVWNLTDSTLNVVLLENQTNLSGDYTSPIVDGIQFKVTAGVDDFKNFEVVANGNGPLDPGVAGALNFVGFPTPNDANPGDDQQVGEGHYAIHTGDNGGTNDGGTRCCYEQFIARTTRDGWGNITPNAFEMRFTGISPGNGGGYAAKVFQNITEVVWVPFELWNIGSNTPDDPSDDYRMIPWHLDLDEDGTYNMSAWGDSNNGGGPGGFEHSASGGNNDPYTDWIYWVNPADLSPGTAGYDAAEAEMITGTYTGNDDTEVWARTVLINWNGGSAPPFNQDLPELGTIFRITSTRPNQPLEDEYLITDSIITDVQHYVEIPTSYHLYQNYPNPFNPTTKIRFNIPVEGIVKLEVYDILGQRVAQLLNTELTAGSHEVVFRGNNLASGVYFYMLNVKDKFFEVKKMILLK